MVQTVHIDESALTRPAEPLRSAVVWYSGYRQAGVAPATHRGLPSPFLTLIFTLDEPLTIARHPDPAQPPGTFDSLLGGLHSSPAFIIHEGRQSGIQIGVSPLAARTLFGLPAGELAALDLPVDDVLNETTADRTARRSAIAAMGRMRDRLHQATNWPDRFAALDDFLTALTATAAGHPPAVAPEVVHAWRLLLRSAGRISVEALADEVGWSTRRLSRRLREETGLAPKAAARVIRFDRARRTVSADAAHGERPNLSALAADFGYYDQAHLAREFTALAGCPPSTWLTEQAHGFRNVQATPEQAG